MKKKKKKTYVRVKVVLVEVNKKRRHEAERKTAHDELIFYKKKQDLYGFLVTNIDFEYNSLNLKINTKNSIKISIEFDTLFFLPSDPLSSMRKGRTSIFLSESTISRSIYPESQKKFLKSIKNICQFYPSI